MKHNQIEFLPERSQLEALAKQTGLPILELLRIVRLPEAMRLSGLSEDGLRRHHADKIIHLSPRAVGMRVVHALMIGQLSKRWDSA